MKNIYMKRNKMNDLLFGELAVFSKTVFQNGRVTSLPTIRERNNGRCECVLAVLVANIAAVNCTSIQFLLKHK